MIEGIGLVKKPCKSRPPLAQERSVKVEILLIVFVTLILASTVLTGSRTQSQAATGTQSVTLTIKPPVEDSFVLFDLLSVLSDSTVTDGADFEDLLANLFNYGRRE